MPKKPQGPHLYLKRRPDGAGVWYVRDGKNRFSTGCLEGDRSDAELLLRGYLLSPKGASKGRVDENLLVTRVAEAKRRALKQRKPFDLTIDFVAKLAAAQNWTCALTGLEFQAPTGGRNNPFVLSIDRIDPERGYIEGNVRLVLFAMNAALGSWGEGIFFQVARAYMARKNTAVSKHDQKPQRQSGLSD